MWLAREKAGNFNALNGNKKWGNYVRGKSFWHCKVVYLVLEMNKIGDAGAEALAETLQNNENTKLKKLKFGQNELSNAGKAALQAAADARGLQLLEL